MAILIKKQLVRLAHQIVATHLNGTNAFNLFGKVEKCEFCRKAAFEILNEL